MQDRYVGDVGDFGKFGLLRSLCGFKNQKPRLNLSVIWYRTIPESKESSVNDGKHRSYLNKPQEYRSCDSELFDKMEIFHDKKHRSLQAVRSSGILSFSTKYYEEELSFFEKTVHGSDSTENRRAIRQNWLAGALESCRSSDLIFLDPDNGLEIQSVSPTNKRGPKYVSEEELKSLLKYSGQSIILYQHGKRNKDFMKENLGRISKICTDRKPFALLYKRGTQRAFIIIPSAESHTLLLHRTKVFLSSEWHNHFAPEIFFP